MGYCQLSAIFFLVVPYMQIHVFGLYRMVSGLLVMLTSTTYHGCGGNCFYLVDQLVIWPAGLHLLSFDYSLKILVLVTYAVYQHFVRGPLTDGQHCLHVHMPIIVALALQRAPERQM